MPGGGEMSGKVRKYLVTVEVDVLVVVDHEKFTDDVMRGYNEDIRPEAGVKGHIENLAIAAVQDPFVRFVEGYGDLSEVGVRELDVGFFEVTSFNVSEVTK